VRKFTTKLRIACLRKLALLLQHRVDRACRRIARLQQLVDELDNDTLTLIAEANSLEQSLQPRNSRRVLSRNIPVNWFHD
jgi:Txe/YoeB family toxin of Txe-Axe toxin-antitoxin module